MKTIKKEQLMIWDTVYKCFDGTCNIPQKILDSPMWDGNVMEVGTFTTLCNRYNDALTSSYNPLDEYGVSDTYWKEITIHSDCLIYKTNWMKCEIEQDSISINDVKVTLDNVGEILNTINEVRVSGWNTPAYLDLIPIIENILKRLEIGEYYFEFRKTIEIHKKCPNGYGCVKGIEYFDTNGGEIVAFDNLTNKGLTFKLNLEKPPKTEIELRRYLFLVNRDDNSIRIESQDSSLLLEGDMSTLTEGDMSTLTEGGTCTIKE